MDIATGRLKSGFSLIEIVIAIAIIGLMVGVGVPLVMNQFENSKKKSTKLSLNGYKQSIELFHTDTNSYPNELNDLVEKPSDERLAAKWAGPYMERLALDGWDRDFVYERTPQASHPYELYSFGKNGEDAPEEERISVWE